MSKPLLEPREDRRVYDLQDFGVPEVPILGVDSPVHASRGLWPHVHEGLMEICYLVKGELVFESEGRDYVMKGNTLFWTGEDEVHGSGRHPYGKGLLYWLQIRVPRKGERFLGLSESSSEVLGASLHGLSRRLFVGNRKVKDVFEACFRLCSREPSRLLSLSISAHLVQWFLAVVECARAKEEGALSRDIRAALLLIEEHPESDLGIIDLAEAAGLSASRFKAKFREQVGIAPRDYVLRHKVNLAEQMLRQGDLSVTDIAYTLGFSSSQYFATVFKRYNNRSPSDIRMAML